VAETQTWAARNDRSESPLAVAELFPVRILPPAAYRTLQHKTADITLLYRCDAPPTDCTGRLLHRPARRGSLSPQARAT
jgi:hypothetical protein